MKMKLSESKILEIKEILHNSTDHSSIGISIRIYSPDNNVMVTFASGLSDANKQEKLNPNSLFRIASVTKTFIAASILRLHEEKLLNIKSPIKDILSDNIVRILESGDYNPNKITIAHLLSHSSGLYDHTNSTKFIEKIKNEPSYFWTRLDQITTCINYGNKLCEPGKAFNYSDTGYIILGEVIESITKNPLSVSVPLILSFEELGLNNTIWEDESLKIERIHQYVKFIDTYELNPSFDLYGGGGLLSNCIDLAKFYYDLFNGRIYKNNETINIMLTLNNYSSIPELDYRYGVFKINIEGLEGFSHTGYWGTQVAYFPEIKTSIAINYSNKWEPSGNCPILPIIINSLKA